MTPVGALPFWKEKNGTSKKGCLPTSKKQMDLQSDSVAIQAEALKSALINTQVNNMWESPHWSRDIAVSLVRKT